MAFIHNIAIQFPAQPASSSRVLLLLLCVYFFSLLSDANGAGCLEYEYKKYVRSLNAQQQSRFISRPLL
jgi:hypothetical protein